MVFVIKTFYFLDPFYCLLLWRFVLTTSYSLDMFTLRMNIFIHSWEHLKGICNFKFSFTRNLNYKLDIRKYLQRSWYTLHSNHSILKSYQHCWRSCLRKFCRVYSQTFWTFLWLFLEITSLFLLPMATMFQNQQRSGCGLDHFWLILCFLLVCEAAEPGFKNVFCNSGP